MKKTISLGFVSFVNISLTIIFQWYLITHLGFSNNTDAYFSGSVVPLLISVVITGSLSSVLVPQLTVKNISNQRRDTWHVLFFGTIILTLLAVILSISAHIWVPIIFIGFDSVTLRLTTDITRVFLIIMVTSVVLMIQSCFYHARDELIKIELVAILAGIISLVILIYLLPNYGVIGAAWVLLLKHIIQVLLLSTQIGPPIKPDIKDGLIVNLVEKTKPLILSSLYYKSSFIIDRCLLSTAFTGSIALYAFVQQIYSAANQLLIKAFVSPKFPILSSLYNYEKHRKFRHLFLSSFIKLLIICSAIITFIIIFGRDILQLILTLKGDNAESIDEFWLLMIALSGSVIGGVIGQLVTTSFYSRNDTSTVPKIAMITYTIAIPIKIISFFNYGLFGLAITTSLYVGINMIILLSILLVRLDHHHQ